MTFILRRIITGTKGWKKKKEKEHYMTQTESQVRSLVQL